MGSQEENRQEDAVSGVMNIDRLVHSPARLAILLYLSVVDEGDAVYLLNRTGLTWGNLSANMSKLEEAGYIAIAKQFKGKKPHTVLKLTDKGRLALAAYQTTMKGLLGNE